MNGKVSKLRILALRATTVPPFDRLMGWAVLPGLGVWPPFPEELWMVACNVYMESDTLALRRILSRPEYEGRPGLASSHLVRYFI